MGAEDDSNDVGMPDDWQQARLGKVGQWSNLDSDQDGLTNLQEYLIGTDPLSADTGNTGVIDSGKATGYLTYEYWLNVAGTSASSFVASDRYLQIPNGRPIVKGAVEPSNLSQNSATALRGYFVPVVSGTVRILAKTGSDGVAGYLSSDSTSENRSLLFEGLNKGALRVLNAGQPYYFELIHKTGSEPKLLRCMCSHREPRLTCQWMQRTCFH